MNRFLMVVLSVAFFAVCSFAQDSTKAAAAPKAEKKAAAGKVETLHGTIVSIDTAAKTVVVKDTTGAEKTFTFKAKGLSALKKDEAVVVKYKEGSDVAESVKAAPKKK